MCGIAGWMAVQRHAPDDGAMAAVLEALAHRGPDGSGACAFQASRHRVVLGHRRLAIIDPQGARQPMCDDAAGIALTFNGEIYNFRELRAQLAARGLSLRARLRHRGAAARLPALGHRAGASPARAVRLRGLGRAQGAAAARARSLRRKAAVPVRERRVGFLRLRRSRRCSRFRASGREVDLHAVRDYLAYRYVPGPRTLFAGIRKLMPGDLRHMAVRPAGAKCATGRPPDRNPRAPAKIRDADAVAQFRPSSTRRSSCRW